MGRRAGDDDLEPLPVDAAPPGAALSEFSRPEDIELRESTIGGRLPRVVLVVAFVAVVVLVVVLFVVRGRDDPAGDVRAIDRAWQRAQATSRAADDASIRVRTLLSSGNDGTVAPALGAVRREERDRLAGVDRDVRDVSAHDDLVKAARDAVVEAITLLERRATAATMYYTSGRTGVSLVPGLDAAIDGASRRTDDALGRARARWRLGVASAAEPRFASFDRVVASLGPVADTAVHAPLLLSTDHGLVVLVADTARNPVRFLDHTRNPAEFVVGDGFVAVSRAGFPGWTLLDEAGDAVGIDLPGDPIPASAGGIWLLRGQTATRVDRRARFTTETVRIPEEWRPYAEAGGAFVLLSTGRVDRPSFRVWTADGAVDRTLDGFPVAASRDLLGWTRCDARCVLAVMTPRAGTGREVALADPSFEAVTFSPDGRWLAVAATSSTGMRGVVIVDAATLENTFVALPSIDALGAITWSPDSRRVFVVDLATGDRIAWFALADRRPHLVKLRPAFRDAVRVFDLAVLAQRARAAPSTSSPSSSPMAR